MQLTEYPEVTFEFGHWLAGFIAGEGTFVIHRQNVSHGHLSYGTKCIVKLRDDDRAVLDEIAAQTGIGRVYWKPPGNDGRTCRAQVAWQVQSRAECMRLVEILDVYPLRAKKATAYAIWRKAVLVGIQRKNGGNWAHEENELLWERIAELRVDLARANGYSLVTPAH